MREAAGPKLKNYITPAGLQRLKDEHKFLLLRERPAVTTTVSPGLDRMSARASGDIQLM